MALACVWAATAIDSSAAAQDRPSEAEMFGAPAASGSEAAGAPAPAPGAPQPAAEPPAAAAPDATESHAVGAAIPEPGPAVPLGAAPPTTSTNAGDKRDEAVLGTDSRPMFDSPLPPEDPLSIGGQLYLRAQTRSYEGRTLGDSAFNFPTLLDVFLDARPNDRVRGYVLGRMTYDPTVSANRPQLSATEAANGAANLTNLFGTPRIGPQVRLDQMWLRFDIDHTVFVTAGKQHVRWGTAHVWSPTDYLHVLRRNPLEVFDARTGTTMLKAHLPIESKAWNFYAYGVAEGPEGVPTLAQLGAAMRAELVFGVTELGLGAFAQKPNHPKFAADVSTGIGDFDLFLEVALRNRDDVDRVRYAPDAELPNPPERESWQTDAEYMQAQALQIAEARFPRYREQGYRPQTVAGLSYSFKYHENDVFTISAEYFYNPLGYGSSDVYPGLLAPRSVPLRDPATYFYLGQHYAALVLTAPAPFSLDLHSFTLSTLANLSDRSFLTQLSYSLVLLTHLRFEAYVAAHYGRPSGEFRLRVQFEGVQLLPAALFDTGIALRLSI
jgi:hypothetical protein